MMNVSIFIDDERIGVATLCDEMESLHNLSAFSFYRFEGESKYNAENVGIILLSIGVSIGEKYRAEFWQADWVINFITKNSGSKEFAHWLVSELTAMIPSSVSAKEQRRLSVDQSVDEIWTAAFGGRPDNIWRKIKDDCAKEALLGLCLYLAARNEGIASADRSTIS